jgi:hypothetical protein
MKSDFPKTPQNGLKAKPRCCACLNARFFTIVYIIFNLAQALYMFALYAFYLFAPI